MWYVLVYSILTRYFMLKLFNIIINAILSTAFTKVPRYVYSKKRFLIFYTLTSKQVLRKIYDLKRSFLVAQHLWQGLARRHLVSRSVPIGINSFTKYIKKHVYILLYNMYEIQNIDYTIIFNFRKNIPSFIKLNTR